MRTLELKTRQLSRLNDGSPFIIDKGELRIGVVLPNTVGDFFLSWRIKDLTTPHTVQIPKSGEIAIKCTSAGILEMEAKWYIGGKLVERYKIEPLVLCKADDSISVVPEITALRGEIANLQVAVGALHRSVQTVKEGAETVVRRNLIAFIMFAWAEYQTDFQLNTKNLALREFIRKLGYDDKIFTDDTIAKIEKCREVF